jgi:hypothetical protein
MIPVTLPYLLSFCNLELQTAFGCGGGMLCTAPWCNWLTRGPFKAESTGSIPVGATKPHYLQCK